MNAKLLATVTPGLTTRVVPLSPLHDQAARIELPGNVQELIGEGANYAVVETTGSSISRELGPDSLTQSPAWHNGSKPNPDLRFLRALAIECVSTVAGPRPAWAGDPEMTRTIGYIADAGQTGTAQTAAAALLTEWAPDEVYTVGDFSYSVATSGSAGMNADLAAFSAFITAGKLWPVFGNHEWDAAGVMAIVDAKFPYVSAFPATSYYDRLVTDEAGVPFLHAVYLDGGRKSDWSAAGAGLTGGAAPGSTQWQWMLDRIAMSDRYAARWRIACIHWPMTTGVNESTIMPELVALARSGHFDLILCGHTHSNEELIIHGVPVLNVSTASKPVRTASDTLRGALGDARTAWSESTAHCVTRLHLTADRLTWEVYDTASAAEPIRTRNITPRPLRPLGAFRVYLQDGTAGAPAVKCDVDLQAGDSLLLKFPQGMPFTGTAAYLSISGSLTAPAPQGTMLRAIAIGF